jgi:hypothetical protein
MVALFHIPNIVSIQNFLYSCYGVSDTKKIAADANNSKKMPNINAKACDVIRVPSPRRPKERDFQRS